MADTQQTHDPYAPPPRYKNKSGAMVRAALLAAMLAGAAWGYMTLQNMPQTARVTPAPGEQSFADASSQDDPPLVTQAPVAPAATPQTPGAGAARTPPADRAPPPSILIAPDGPNTPARD